MANDRRKRAIVDKWKKKKQFKLIAPKLFGNSEFGETIATKPEQLVGRVVKLNLSILTNRIKSKNSDVFLRILKVEGSNAHTDVVGLEVKRTFLRRMFRRRTSKVEINDSFVTKDKQKLRIKFVAVTRGKQEALKVKAIRKILFDFMKKVVGESSVDNFFEQCMDNKKLFAPIIPELKKISRINTVEVEKVRLKYK